MKEFVSFNLSYVVVVVGAEQRVYQRKLQIQTRRGPPWSASGISDCWSRETPVFHS